MLYYTSSSIADRQLTCSLMEDEKMIMSEVDARAKAYMMRAELSHDWDTARRVACSDILDDAKLTALEYQKELEKVKSGELVSLESAIREYKLDPAQLKQDIEQRKVMVTKFGHLNKKQIENYK
ncbi:hypothetical protein KY316_02025 [Candidatus Woesearchaeota archaeon]|nr:hypothetical protein [Candidatus Woesearchaeota archaeon]